MTIGKDAADCFLYLVTDTGLLPSSEKSFEDHIEQLIDGGVTIVQLREKSVSTADFVHRGKKRLEITRPKQIPLIIHDLSDVALAIDADGVHVRLDDMRDQSVIEMLFWSGCSLASGLGACLAVQRSHKLLATLTAVLWYYIASEFGAEKCEVSGPGAFLSAFVDEIDRLSAGNYEWIEKGKLSRWIAS